MRLTGHGSVANFPSQMFQEGRLGESAFFYFDFLIACHFVHFTIYATSSTLSLTSVEAKHSTLVQL